MDLGLNLGCQLLHVQVATDLVFVNVKISIVEVELDFAWLLSSTESTKVNFETWCVHFDYRFLVLLLCFSFSLFNSIDLGA